MNNMQKAFKEKGACGLADGGRPNPHMLGTGMAAGAGIALARRPQQIEEAVEAATAPPAPQVAPAGRGGLSGIRDNAMPPAYMLAAQRRGLADGGKPKRKMKDPLQEAIKLHETHMENPATATMKSQRELMGLMREHQAMMKNSGMADGGYIKRKPNGGEVEGPGGPTDDEAGVFALSNDEYVLPADTVEAMGGAEVLDEIRNATHEFVDEKNRPGLANGGLGGAYDWMKNKVGGLRGGQPAPAAPAAPSVAPNAMSDGITNAERVAATPKGYVTGGLARPPSRALSMAKGVGTKVVAPLAAVSAIGDSAAEDSTARYAKRFGVSEPTGDGSMGDMLKFAGLRAGGFASDLGNTLTLGLAGKMYRDRPGEASDAPVAAPSAPTAQAAAAPATPVNPEDARVSQELASRGVSLPDQGGSRMSYPDAQASSMRGGLGAGKQYKLGGGQYDTGNADIFATSTRPDGKLNSFTGVGNGNRPNWEDRPENRQNYLDAVARAAADKSKVAALAVGNIDGTADGLDRAWRLASGDPEATAAVTAALQQQGLRRAALNGNKGAADILAQQGRDATDVRVANITTSGAERVGLAKARADMAKAAQDQKNADREFELRQNADARAGGKQRRDEVNDKLTGIFGPQIGKDGALNPAYAEFKAAIDETLLGRTVDGTPNGRQATLEDLGDQKLEQYAQDFKAYKQDNPGSVRGFIDWVLGKEVAETNNLDDMAVKPGSAQKGFFNDTYQTVDGRTRYMNEETLPGLRRAGFLPQGGR